MGRTVVGNEVTLVSYLMGYGLTLKEGMAYLRALKDFYRGERSEDIELRKSALGRLGET